jgi:hypothetical protein
MPMDRALGLALIAVMAVGLALLAGVPLQVPGWALVGLVTLLAVLSRRLALREAYLLSLVAGLSLLVWLIHPDRAPRVLAGALDQATYLLAFILTLGLLNEAASTSPAVAGVGQFLTRQPPARRYAALNLGTAALAVMFNIGTISFLVPLVQRGIATRGPDDGLNPVRERRQISALLRGFAWSVVWSPTAVAPLVVAGLIPGVERGRWMVIGLAVFALMLVLGALEDWLRFRHLRGRAGVVNSPVPWAAALRFAAACGWLMGMTVLLAELTGGGIITGLLLSCPLMLLGWQAVQTGLGPSLAPRLRAIRDRLPAAAPVAVTLAASGFVGRLAADLVQAEAVARLLGFDRMPDFLLLWCIPLALMALSLMALSPIMMAVFFGSLFGSLPLPPADPTLIAFAISCGWALAMTFSPFATPVLMAQRAAGIVPRQLTLGWNLTFTLLAAAALLPVFALLTSGS